MEVNRNITLINKSKEKVIDDEVSSLSSAENVGFVWELTKEIYSLTGNFNAESRLQRDVISIIRK